MAANNIPAALVLSVFVVLAFLPELGRVVSRSPDSNEYWADPVEQKKAGLWLKENATAPKIIMSRNHAVDFYAGSYDITKSVTIPKNDLERVLAYAKHRGANYLVVNDRYRSTYPQIAFLLETDEAVAGLKLIYDDQDQSDLVTRIFQIL